MIDLKSILIQYPNCLNSRTSFKTVLMDNYPLERRMVNILTILFECGVANKIKSMINIDANEMHNFIAQIESEYGISEQYSQNAILVWADAYNVSATSIQTSSQVKNCYNKTSAGTIDCEYVDIGNDTIEIISYKGQLPTNIVFPDYIDNKKSCTYW